MPRRSIRADTRASARHAFLRFRKSWHPEYPVMVRQLERDLPELLVFYSFPKPLWNKLRTTNLIEPVFVEVRRRTRPIVCFVNVASVDRIIYSIFQRFKLEWRTAPSASLHKPLDITAIARLFDYDTRVLYPKTDPSQKKGIPRFFTASASASSFSWNMIVRA
ncbi:MAG: transposase [Bryobacteraceae bacterium]